MPTGLPYLTSPGSITKGLDKIKNAATPDKVTTDFITTKLGMKGGSGRALLPFLKKIGFVNSDGTPSDLYIRFRNPSDSEVAVAEAIKIGYKALYDSNEYTHELGDDDLKGLIVQVTGQEPDSNVVSLSHRTFKKLKEKARFDYEHLTPASLAASDEQNFTEATETAGVYRRHRSNTTSGLSLSYTINLNLPPTSDISVFNAIFKSLKDNLLDAYEPK